MIKLTKIFNLLELQKLQSPLIKYLRWFQRKATCFDIFNFEQKTFHSQFLKFFKFFKFLKFFKSMKFFKLLNFSIFQQI